MAIYIGKREDEALKRFASEDITDRERTTLYSQIIYPAFKKLSDNLIFKYNQKSEDVTNDLRDDCVSHLTMQISKYDFNRGNSFSFFNVIAKHFILQHVGRKKKFSSLISVYRKDPSENSMGTDENTLSREALVSDQFVDTTYLQAGEDKGGEFKQFLLTEFAKVYARCKDKDEKDFIKAITTILEHSEDLNISNKKQVYLVIRNITDFKSRDITKYINRLKLEYQRIVKKYYEL